MRKTGAVLLLLTMMLGIPAHAHHSYAGIYLVDQQQTLAGVVVELTIQNPHSFLIIEVEDSRDRASRWTLEWTGITHLKNTGVVEGTLKTGDKVLVTGAPRTDPSDPQLLLRKITRPADGWTWPRPREATPEER